MSKNKTIFASALLCLCLGAAFTSCSDKEEDEPALPAAREVAGTYSGDMTCSVMGQESQFEDMTFTVVAVDDSSVDITVSEFGQAPMAVPSFTVEGVKVSGAEDSYTLASTDFEGQTATGRAYSGKLQGSYSGTTLSVQFNLQYGAMPMPMICSFSAPKN